jgi:hypothetical protein
MGLWIQAGKETLRGAAGTLYLGDPKLRCGSGKFGRS